MPSSLRRILLSSVALLATASFCQAAPPVTLIDNGPDVTLSNGIVSITIVKTDGTIPNMTLGSSPNLAGRGAYFAVLNSKGKDGRDVHDAVYTVIRKTPDLVELSFDAPIGNIHFDQHYILRRGDHGYYVYVNMKHHASEPDETNMQIRWSMYLNKSLFNYQLASDSEQGPIPDLDGAKAVQDATFQLADGTVYTKYNYCTYIEEDDVHGITGSGKGGYGAFVVMPGKEYLQAPTKQDITLHAPPIIHRLLVSGHFEPRELSPQHVSGEYSKLYGPWMIYLNSGNSPRDMWKDAKSQFKKEAAQWPYAWMKDPDYPLVRGEITGDLKLYDGKHPAANALMVLAAPKPDWQIQTLGYIFSTRADAAGRFMLPHVRPGDYSLYAMIPGVTDQFQKADITVKAGEKLDLGTLNFVPSYYSQKLWQIGTATWRAVGYKYSDERRQYGLDQKVPADLTYTIGKSTPAHDWYYAQAKRGKWNIQFTVTKPLAGDAVLTLGIAGQTSNPTLDILINNQQIGTYTGGNSSALYRSAILGSSYHESKIIRFPASSLHPGTNTVTFQLDKGGVQYDVVKLEIDDPNLPKQIP